MAASASRAVLGHNALALTHTCTRACTQKAFPFHAGELYHQYHNDMVEAYGKAYNALRDSKADAGQLELSKCPGDAKLFGALASGDFASAGSINIFKDKSIND